MISTAFQYAGLGIIAGMCLVTVVVALSERRDHSLDVDDLDGTPIRPRCTHPTYTSQRTDNR